VSYRLKARAPLGAYGVSPMPTITVSKRFAAGPVRSAQAAVAGISACALLLVLGLGTWQARRQAAIAADAAAALTQLRGQQVQIQTLARQVAELRSAGDLVRAEIAKLSGSGGEPAQAAAESPIAAPMPVLAKTVVPLTPGATAKLPAWARAPLTMEPPPSTATTEASLPIPPVPATAEGQPAQRREASRHATHRKHRAKTVRVNGVTYVRGREPHALSLPTE
jgi:hypothetical protein